MSDLELSLKPSETHDYLVGAIAERLAVMLQGEPGTGKTEIVEQAAATAGADLIVSHPVVSDPTDYKGQPWVVDGKATFLPFTELRKTIDADKPTVFFLDDLGQALPSVQAAAMQLILGRNINGHKVSPHVTFMAATNRRTDKAGVVGILEPVKSRFATILHMRVDVEDWVGWAIGHDVPTPLISFIRFRPNMLMDFKPSNDMTNSPSPRTVVNVGKNMKVKMPANVELSVYSGAAGKAFAVEFVGFLRIFRSLPRIDSILMDPKSAEVPDDPATLYALCGALANHASEQNIERLVTYGNRLTDEFNVLMMRDCTKHAPEIMDTRTFITWAHEHQDVLI